MTTTGANIRSWSLRGITRKMNHVKSINVLQFEWNITNEANHENVQLQTSVRNNEFCNNKHHLTSSFHPVLDLEQAVEQKKCCFVCTTWCLPCLCAPDLHCWPAAPSPPQHGPPWRQKSVQSSNPMYKTKSPTEAWLNAWIFPFPNLKAF